MIQRGKKQGLGTAIKAGLDYAIAHHYDYAVNLDADFSHDPHALPTLVSAAIAEKAGVKRYVSISAIGAIRSAPAAASARS